MSSLPNKFSIASSTPVMRLHTFKISDVFEGTVQTMKWNTGLNYWNAFFTNLTLCGLQFSLKLHFCIFTSISNLLRLKRIPSPLVTALSSKTSNEKNCKVSKPLCLKQVLMHYY